MRHSLAFGLVAVALALPAPARAADKPPVVSRPADPANATRGRAGQKIDRIVIHTVEGSQGSAVATFGAKASHVSAHYVVGKDGSVVQCVADADMAWHAGSANPTSIGIEHEGSSRSAATWTPALLDSSARLTRWLCDTYSIPIDRQHIVGHSEVRGETHGDPGPHFDWAAYLERVRRAGSRPLPVSATAPVSSTATGTAAGSTAGGSTAPGSTATGTAPGSTAPGCTAAGSTAADGLPFPFRVQPLSSAAVAAIESRLAAEHGQGCFGVPGSAASSSSTSPVTTGTTGTSPAGTGSGASGNGASTTAASSTAAVTSSQAAEIIHEVAGLVTALDKAFEAIEGTIAAVESREHASPTTPVTPTPTPSTKPAPAPSPAPSTTPSPANEPLCALGSTGPAVRRIQALVGARVDGIYGPETQAAVRAFQAAHGCKVDGIVGPETWGALDRVGGSTSQASSGAGAEVDDAGLAGPSPARGVH